MTNPILSRHVWYFHGFDPARTQRYRRIFEAASVRHNVSVRDLPEEEDGWRAIRNATATDFHYLRYENLVRDAQAGGPFARIGRGIRAVAGLIAARPRLPARTWALACSPLLVAFAPLFFLAPWLDRAPMIAGGLLILGLAVAGWLLLRMKMLLASDLFAYLRVLAAGQSEGWKTYRERIMALGSRITPTGDETVVVGHSLGGIAAIFAVDDVLVDWPARQPLALLTLGSVHGLILRSQGAGRDNLAEAIARISADTRVTWIDVTSPRDAFTVPLTDPLLLIGDAAGPGMKSPQVIAAQLRDVPAIPGDRRTIFRAMRRHMGYLLAPSGNGGFDYVDLVTGSLSLAQRSAARGNSPKARMWQG